MGMTKMDREALKKVAEDLNASQASAIKNAVYQGSWGYRLSRSTDETTRQALREQDLVVAGFILTRAGEYVRCVLLGETSSRVADPTQTRRWVEGEASLKSCPNPWCQSHDIEISSIMGGDGFFDAWARCRACELVGPGTVNPCEETARQLAIATWNDRPSIRSEED